MRPPVPPAPVDLDGRPIPLYDTGADYDGLAAAGRLAAETLDHVLPMVVPGVATIELDRTIDTFVRSRGGVPATVGYRGYHHASCISPNHVVTHGIPGERRLRAGDIVNIDVTVILDGWHGDTSRMALVGDSRVPVKARRLVDATWRAMMAGITAIRPGATLGDVGHACQRTAEAAGFSPVDAFCGHGIGRVFNDAPQVMHVGRPGNGVVLRPGMVFTVEPMLNAGRPETKTLADGWTVVTRDRSLSAQFEHTVGVTADGLWIFTLSPAGLDRPPHDGILAR
ncbi:MAG: type I methionyl aminopeptidase [Alphaproteobacteria bacterium]|nr:type I methionyl aminopeptidase [Alphaproteobacteria bacterium]